MIKTRKMLSLMQEDELHCPLATVLRSMRFCTLASGNRHHLRPCELWALLSSPLWEMSSFLMCTRWRLVGVSAHLRSCLSAALSSLVYCPVSSSCGGVCNSQFYQPKGTTTVCLGSPSMHHDPEPAGTILRPISFAPHLSGIIVLYTWCPMSWELLFHLFCGLSVVSGKKVNPVPVTTTWPEVECSNIFIWILLIWCFLTLLGRDRGTIFYLPVSYLPEDENI